MRAKWKILLLIACFLWAISFIATKVALRSTPPLTVASLRLVVAALFFLGWCLVRRTAIRTGGVSWWAELLLLSVVGMGHYAVQTIGLQYTTASNASLYAVTGPVTIVLLGALFLKERITGRKAVGVILAIAGVLTVMGLDTLLKFQFQAHLWGDLLVLASLVMWGAFTVFGKKMTDQLGAFTFTTVTTTLGAIWMIPVGWTELAQRGMTLSHIDAAAWWAIVFLGAACGFLATLLYFMALRHTESQKVGVYLYTVPPMTAVVAAFYLGETIGVNLILGSALVFGGVYLTDRG
ncbi:MAG: DMT family transporter [Pseudomonadota bacterium]